MRDLVVYHDDNSVFSDYTDDARDYIRDDISIDFVSVEDFIYIGLYKPFNKLFLELSTFAIADINLSAEYYNGVSYASLELRDDSKGFTRSGFIDFEKPEDWASNEVNGNSNYHIRISADDFTAVIRGLNIVFADDNDLQKEVRCIDEFTQGSDTSFIAYHVSSRDEIIQTLNNGGNSTQIEGTGVEKRLTKFDLLDIGEIRQAAKFLCLSKIFFDVSENPDDKHYQRYMDFNQKFGEAFKLYRMSLDRNDDGIADKEEKTQIRRMSLSKR